MLLRMPPSDVEDAVDVGPSDVEVSVGPVGVSVGPVGVSVVEEEPVMPPRILLRMPPPEVDEGTELPVSVGPVDVSVPSLVDEAIDEESVVLAGMEGLVDEGTDELEDESLVPVRIPPTPLVKVPTMLVRIPPNPPSSEDETATLLD